MSKTNKSPTRLEDPILRIPRLTAELDVCRATLYNWQRQGIFPRFIQLGPGAVGLRRSTYEAWLKSREELSRSNSCR